MKPAKPKRVRLELVRLRSAYSNGFMELARAMKHRARYGAKTELNALEIEMLEERIEAIKSAMIIAHKWLVRLNRKAGIGQ